MKRMTEQHYKKTDGYYMKCSEHCCKEDFSCEDCEKFDELVDRLAAYEDTGLEPKEIKAIAGLASENCAKTADAIDKLLQDDAELKSYRELGSIDRLRELAQADREGRCVVLPCKIGDTLYRIQRFKRGKNWRKEAEFIRTVELNRNNFWRIVMGGEIGKTVFLARAEAEAALRREQDG